MAVRHAEATWQGTLKEGSGQMKFSNYNGPFTWASRFADGQGTNPEELIGAAQAGCFSMFLSALLTNGGYTPDYINTHATVHLGDGPTIHTIELETEASVPGLDDATFQEKAAEAKQKCPVAKALAGVDIKLNATLKTGD
jgi:osmotically inducible protein OsmC